MYANKNVCARFVISYSFFVFVITSQHQGRVMRINLTKSPKYRKLIARDETVRHSLSIP